MVKLATKVADRSEDFFGPDPRGSIILYISEDAPTEADRKAEEAVRAFDPNVDVQPICNGGKQGAWSSTPRILACGSFFRGLDSIEGFIRQMKIWGYGAS